MKNLIIASLIILCAFTASAQSKIDKAIKEIERRENVQATYTEHRTTKGKKLYRITKTISFNDTEIYRKLAKAFEEERSHTITATLSNGTYIYRFEDNKSESRYILSPNSIVMSWNDTTISPNETSSSIDFDTRADQARLMRKDYDRMRKEARQLRDCARRMHQEARRMHEEAMLMREKNIMDAGKELWVIQIPTTAPDSDIVSL